MDEIIMLSSTLHLTYIKNNYSEAINETMDMQYSYEDFLKLILSKEIDLKKQNRINTRIKKAKFPYLKVFEEMNFGAFSLEIANKIRELQNLNFLDTGQNVILVVDSGIGKTHTAIILGIRACMVGKSVLYITVLNLITKFKKSMTINQLTAYKKKFINYDLVILDELGYIFFDKLGEELLFNLLSMRNDTKSMIITTNLAFNK